ncbi:MAG: hypothetical protein LBU89_01445 [Fibromonadaceae bacterium]|nr:hypothetical protein [Fibromonadaceae bacterium]
MHRTTTQRTCYTISRKTCYDNDVGWALAATIGIAVIFGAVGSWGGELAYAKFSK